MAVAHTREEVQQTSQAGTAAAIRHTKEGFNRGDSESSRHSGSSQAHKREGSLRRFRVRQAEEGRGHITAAVRYTQKQMGVQSEGKGWEWGYSMQVFL